MTDRRLELLHVDQLRSAPVSPDTTRFATPDTDAETVVYTPHPDESQVLLDTRRSFITYPRGEWRAHAVHALQARLLGVKWHTGSGRHGYTPAMCSMLTLEDISSNDKSEMQEDLQLLICTVLQRHPRLSYFQGFHDIMTVLYLTLLSRVPRPRKDETAQDREEWDELVRAAEVVALCRTRDAMGKGLGPMMGMLKLLRRVLAAADPQLYRISSS